MLVVWSLHWFLQDINQVHTAQCNAPWKVASLNFKDTTPAAPNPSQYFTKEPLAMWACIAHKHRGMYSDSQTDDRFFRHHLPSRLLPIITSVGLDVDHFVWSLSQDKYRHSGKFPWAAALHFPASQYHELSTSISTAFSAFYFQFLLLGWIHIWQSVSSLDMGLIQARKPD